VDNRCGTAIAILVLGLLVAPLAGGAQPAGKTDVTLAFFETPPQAPSTNSQKYERIVLGRRSTWPERQHLSSSKARSRQ